MTGGQLNANVEQYLQAAASNTPPPTILSDPVIPGLTPVEQWMAVLTAAANLSDAADNAQAVAEHAERDAKMREAAEKFAAQDELAAAELESIAAQPYSFTGGDSRPARSDRRCGSAVSADGLRHRRRSGRCRRRRTSATRAIAPASRSGVAAGHAGRDGIAPTGWWRRGRSAAGRRRPGHHSFGRGLRYRRR